MLKAGNREIIGEEELDSMTGGIFIFLSLFKDAKTPEMMVTEEKGDNLDKLCEHYGLWID